MFVAYVSTWYGTGTAAWTITSCNLQHFVWWLGKFDGIHEGNTVFSICFTSRCSIGRRPLLLVSMAVAMMEPDSQPPSWDSYWGGTCDSPTEARWCEAKSRFPRVIVVVQCPCKFGEPSLNVATSATYLCSIIQGGVGKYLEQLPGYILKGTQVYYFGVLPLRTTK